MSGGLGNASQDSDSFYVQDCRTVQHNTHGIQTLTGQISKKVGSLETESDLQQCRSMVDDAVKKATDTSLLIARIKEHSANVRDQAERSNRRLMYRKLSDNLAITARVLEDVIRRLRNEESRRPIPQVAADADAAGGEEQHLTGAGLGMGEQDLAEQRKASLRRVDEDMRCLQRIYTDLAVAAEESQATFESLETHMASASSDIENAFTEIQVMQKPLVQRLKQNPVALGVGALLTVAFGGYILS